MRVQFYVLAAAASVALLVGVAPASAALTANSLTANSLTQNALTQNALASAGSQLDELNGVAAEAVVLSAEPRR